MYPPIHILAVGSLKGDDHYLKAGIDRYSQWLQPYSRVTLTEIPEAKGAKTITVDQLKASEGEKILKAIPEGAWVVALSEHGKTYDSPAFARALDQWLGGNQPNGGAPRTTATPMIVIVGGPWGLDPRVITRANCVLSLSPMTFPHRLARLLLLEQLYRGFKILQNEPYHK